MTRALGLVLVFVAGCNTVVPVSISTDPIGAEISVDGTSIGAAPMVHGFDFDDDSRTYKLTTKLTGYVQSSVNLNKIYLEARGTDVRLRLDPDEAFQGTVGVGEGEEDLKAENDLINKWLNVEANPRLEESLAWPRLVETVSRFYPKLAQTNSEAGYLVSVDKSEGYRQGPDTAKVTNVLYCSLVSKSPLVYKIKVESKINIRGKTDNYPRIFKTDRTLVEELRASLTSE